MSNIKDMFARGLAVVAIVIAIIFGLLSLAGHGSVSAGEQKVANAYGTIYDVFTGDYFNAYRGFQLNGVNIFGVDSTVFTVPSNVTSVIVGGITTTYVHAIPTAATTTPCALFSPAATSTLLSAQLTLTVASGTVATTVTLAKGTTAFATTTPLAPDTAVAAGAQTTVIASSTLISSTRIFAPNTPVVFGIAGGSGGVSSPVGICDATFIN